MWTSFAQPNHPSKLNYTICQISQLHIRFCGLKFSNLEWVLEAAIYLFGNLIMSAKRHKKGAQAKGNGKLVKKRHFQLAVFSGLIWTAWTLWCITFKR